MTPRSDTTVTRRQFGAGVLGAAAVGGVAGWVSGVEAQPRPEPVEMGAWQVARVRIEDQESFQGASALLYHSPGDRSDAARVRFRLYDRLGRLEYEGTDTVRVPAGEERHVAKWFRKTDPARSAPVITSADVEIVEVLG